MSDASDTIRRRQQRTLYANKIITETYYKKGYNNHIIFEGGVGNEAMTYDPYEKMRNGTTQTTTAEVTTYENSVPNRQPDPPTISAVSATNGQATVYISAPSYEGVSPILYYRVQSTDGSIDITVTSLPAVIPGLSSGVSYQFIVYAVNAEGTSLPSATSDATTVVGLPSPPTLTGATLGRTTIDSVVYSSVSVSFTAPTSDGGAPITGYTIVSTPNFVDISGSSHGSGTSSPIVITGLSNGVAYTFRVFATNANGISQLSNTSSSLTPADLPDPPTGLTAIRGNTQAIVQFAPPINNGGAAITTYRAITTPGSFTASGASSPITITGLTNGTAYTVTVRATNSVGNSIESDPSNSVTPATVPDPPTGVSAAAGNGQAVVSFTAPANNGSTITSYTVTSSGGQTATGGASPITVLGLNNGTAYTFTVIATNGIGDSAASTASSAVTPASGSKPGAPTAVSAVPGTTSTSATVSFTAPVNPGTPAYTQFTVTSAPGGLSTTTSASPAIVTGLTAGITYSFSVVATNTVGNSDPGVSNQIIAGSPYAPVLVARDDGITTLTDLGITFTQSYYTGCPVVTNYRYSVNGGPFTSLSPARIASPLTISGLSSNTSYQIKVKATNSYGDSLVSNTLTVSTYALLNVQSFTSSGSWTAPTGVTSVQYMIVAGGGGGGGCFSAITVLGDVPFVASSPGPNSYWIVNQPGQWLHGYMMRGNSYSAVQRPNFAAARVSVLSVLNSSPNYVVPNRAGYPQNRWYAQSFVYNIQSGFPIVSSYWSNYTTEQCNNSSGGSGGGAGGEIVRGTIAVVPSTVYPIVVGAGGAGGTATTTVENAGSPGGSSSFNGVTAAGGSGGGNSRSQTNSTNGYNKGGYGNRYGGIYGGQGGSGGSLYFTAPDAFALYNSGGAGGQGLYLNFDGAGTKIYSAGGTGGVPNTPATVASVANLGVGGKGTGATLNAAANGMDGGSGIVILKWYT